MKINTTAKLFLAALFLGLFITAGTYFTSQSKSQFSGLMDDETSSTNHGYPLSYFNDSTTIDTMCARCDELKATEVYWLQAFGDVVVWSGLSCIVLLLAHKTRTK